MSEILTVLGRGALAGAILIALVGCGTSTIPSGSECVAREDCPKAGEICISGYCRAICTNDEQCEPAFQCRGEICEEVASPSCTSHAQCTNAATCQVPAPQACVAGSCHYGQAADKTPCPLGANLAVLDGECDGGTCVVAVTPCDNNAGCAPDVCIDAGCTAPSSVGGPCDLVPVVDDDDCEGSLICGADGDCRVPLDGTCTANGDCLQALTCINASCKPISGIDGPCDGPGDCNPGLTCYDADHCVSDPACENELAPVFTVQPSNVDVCDPLGDLTLEATATGYGTLTFAWYYHPANPTGAIELTNDDCYSGVKSDTLVVGNDCFCVGCEYFVYAIDACGNSTPSDTVTIVVTHASTEPTSLTASANPVCPGTSTTLTAGGGTHASGASYEWFSGFCGGTRLTGSAHTLTVSPADTTTYYVRRAGDDCGVTTACVSTTITVGTIGISQYTLSVSGKTSLCSAETTDLELDDSDIGVSYQLQIDDTDAGNPVAGTGSLLTWSDVSDAGTYTVVASQNGCQEDMLGSVTLTALDAGDICGPHAMTCQSGTCQMTFVCEYLCTYELNCLNAMYCCDANRELCDPTDTNCCCQELPCY